MNYYLKVILHYYDIMIQTLWQDKMIKEQIKDHKEWKERHQASYSFLTRKQLEKNETDNNENS